MKPIKITFTDNFLNTFDGTQEELDSIVEELRAKFDNGEFEQFDDADYIMIGSAAEDVNYQPSIRVLH